ncbi:hypothetical protein HY008_00250 [Candidatus Woesebacteria bacterium]|nr:hypothetical protein [Candidatus Woesebacteria bacterium]
MAVAKVLATAMVDQLLAEKGQTEKFDLGSLDTWERERLKSQAIEEVVVGTGLQDVSKRQEIEFKGLAKKRRRHCPTTTND